MNRMLFPLTPASIVRPSSRANKSVYAGSEFQALDVSPSDATSITRPRYSPTRSPRTYGVRANRPRPWTRDRRILYELNRLIRLCFGGESFYPGADIGTGL